jgi:hypothetical protein
MTNAVEVAGDVAAVSSAVAGLTLVFVGAISASYDSYEKSEQSSIRSRYQRRAWFAFAGLALAILSTAMALFAKLLDLQCAAVAALASLFVALIFVLFAGLNTVREIR